MFSGKRRLRWKTDMDKKSNAAEEGRHSVTSREEVTDSLTGNSDPKENDCSRIKRKTSVRKQYKQLMNKITNKCITQKSKKQQSSSAHCSPSKENNHCNNLYQNEEETTAAAATSFSQTRPEKSCKEHVIDEEETDIESNIRIHQSSRIRNGENLFLEPYNDNEQTAYNYQQQNDGHTFLQNNSNVFSNYHNSLMTPNVSPDSEVRYFYAENDQDLRILQMLRYVKEVEGGVDLLYRVFQEYKELLDRNEVKSDVDVAQSSQERNIYYGYSESDDRQFLKRNSDQCDNEEENNVYGDTKEVFEQDSYQMQIRYDISASEENTDESTEGLEEYLSFHNETSEKFNRVEVKRSNDAQTETSFESKTNSNSDVESVQDDSAPNPYREFKHDTDENPYREFKYDTDKNPYREFKHDTNEIEDLDDYSCDNEESSNDGFTQIRSEEEYQSVEHVHQRVSYSSDDLSDIIQTATLPYVSFTSTSSSSSFLGENNEINKVSVGIQTNLDDLSLHTHLSKKEFHKKTRSHKRRKPYISPAQLRRRRNRKIQNHKHQTIGLNLESTEDINFGKGDNDTIQYHSQNENALKDCQYNKISEKNDLNIIGNAEKSDMSLLDEINKTQAEVFGNGGIHVTSEESTSALLELIETKSEIYISNSEVKPDLSSVLNNKLKQKINEVIAPNCKCAQEFQLNDPVLNNTLMEADRECPVWNLLRKLESPFKWAPDIMILRGIDHELQDNIIEHLTGKEKEFSKAEKNVFREIVVHLVIAYEKVLDNRIIEAITDVQYCFQLLEQPLIKEGSGNHDGIEFDYCSNTHEYYFQQIKQRRTSFYKYKQENKEHISEENKINEDSLNPQRLTVQFSNSSDQFISSESEQEIQHIPISEANSHKNEQLDATVINSKEINCEYTLLTALNDDKKEEKIQCISKVCKFPNIIPEPQKCHPCHETLTEIKDLFEHISLSEERIDRENEILPEIKCVKENSSTENEKDTIKTTDTNIVAGGHNRDNIKEKNMNCSEVNGTKFENIIDIFAPISNAVCDNDLMGNVNPDQNKGIDNCNHSVEWKEFDPLLTTDSLFLDDANNDSHGKLDKNNINNKHPNYENPILELDELTQILPENKDSNLIEREKKAESALETDGLQDTANVDKKFLKPEDLRKSALQYVAYSMLAHVAYFTGSYEEAYQIAKQLQNKYEKFGNVGKATLLGVQGSMLLEYGIPGNKLGLEFMKKAQELDPDYWEWNLICGKVMGRIRRVEGSNGRKPSHEELTYLEKAIEFNEEDAAAMVHLANVYRAVAHFTYREKLEAQSKKPESVIESRPYVRRGGRTGWLVSWRPQLQEELNPLERWRNPQDITLPRPAITLHSEQKDYLQLAKNLYLKALAAELNCPYNNARCAKGFWSMPHPYKDKERAQSAIFKAIFLAPEDSLVNHYAGLFYEFCRDYEKALQCYERSTYEKTNYPAELNYINLKLRISRPGSYNPLQHYEKLLTKYPNTSHVLQTLCHKGFYYYKMEGLYLLGICTIAKAIKTNPKSEILKSYYPGSFYGQVPPSYNMYELLEDIAMKYKELPEASDNEMFIKSAVEEALSLRPEV